MMCQCIPLLPHLTPQVVMVELARKCDELIQLVLERGKASTVLRRSCCSHGSCSTIHVASYLCATRPTYLPGSHCDLTWGGVL
jgi:hypothetical protein